MTQARQVPTGRQGPRKVDGAGSRDHRAAPRLILCLIPRKLPAKHLQALLKGYDLTMADTWTRARGLARKSAYDLYVVQAPLGWADAPEVCRNIRAFDAHTPLIVYSTQSTAGERREVMSLGAQYVGRSDDTHNLAGTAGQLIMLAELRSMEALRTGALALEDQIVQRLSALDGDRNGAFDLQPRAQERLKLHARRMFALAGGSRANFERLWPSIYERALKRFRPSASSKVPASGDRTPRSPRST